MTPTIRPGGLGNLLSADARCTDRRVKGNIQIVTRNLIYKADRFANSANSCTTYDTDFDRGRYASDLSNTILSSADAGCKPFHVSLFNAS